MPVTWVFHALILYKLNLRKIFLNKKVKNKKHSSFAGYVAMKIN